MAKYKSTPDTMGDMLRKLTETTKIVEEVEEVEKVEDDFGLEDSTVVQPKSSTFKNLHNHKDGQSNILNDEQLKIIKKLEFEDKVRMTYYLSPGIIDILDRIWFELRQEVPQRDRDKVSKSLVVDIALRMGLSNVNEIRKVIQKVIKK